MRTFILSFFFLIFFASRAAPNVAKASNTFGYGNIAECTSFKLTTDPFLA